MLLLCNISQIATGMPYSESPRNKSQSRPIFIKIRLNLTCFGIVQSVPSSQIQNIYNNTHTYTQSSTHMYITLFSDLFSDMCRTLLFRHVSDICYHLVFQTCFLTVCRICFWIPLTSRRT
jgi:hypothetical protein